jgi:uncharacterized protein (DUF1330 family)
MKIHQLPMGARFEYEGAEYVKTGPQLASGAGGQKLIPKYAVLKPLDGPAFADRKNGGPKGYWIGRVDVSDPEAYQQYVAANGVAFKKFGARFLVRGGAFVNPEGGSRTRNVVIEFPSYAQARACWESPEYQAAMQHRLNASSIDLIIIEGYAGAQP